MKRLESWKLLAIMICAIFMIGVYALPARASPDQLVVKADNPNLEIKGLAPPDPTDAIAANTFIASPESASSKISHEPAAIRSQPAASYETTSSGYVTDTGRGRASNVKRLDGAARHPLKLPT